MAFMVPQYTRDTFFVVDTDAGTEVVPADLVGDNPDPEDFEDYIHGTEVFDYEAEKGWYARLSAPGYLDATDWTGPFETLEDAKDYIEETYDVDPDTGEELY